MPVSLDALHQDDQLAKRFIYAYSFLITMLTFGYIFYITHAKLDGPQTRIADTVLGFLLGGSLSAIIQFFYGSSKGSSDKNLQIFKLTQYLATATEGKGREARNESRQKPGRVPHSCHAVIAEGL